MLIITNQEEYNTAIQNNECCLFYVTADWCGPCQQMKPFIKTLEEKYKDKVSFCQVDIDMDDEDFPFCRNDVISIPNFRMYVGINYVDSVKGRDEEGLTSLIDETLEEYFKED